MSKIKNRPEQDLQIALMQHVNARAMPGVVAFHVPNAAKMPVYIGAIMKRMGLKTGMLDLVFIYRGAVFCLELKASKGKLSPEQVAVINELEVAGARTAVAYSLDEALTTLEFWGLLRRDQKFGVSEAQSERELVNV